jgi:hypothetical protein
VEGWNGGKSLEDYWFHLFLATQDFSYTLNVTIQGVKISFFQYSTHHWVGGVYKLLLLKLFG